MHGTDFHKITVGGGGAWRLNILSGRESKLINSLNSENTTEQNADNKFC